MTPVSQQAKSVNAAPAGKRAQTIDPVDVLVFLIPCLQFVRITLVGVLNGSDLMLLAVFVYLVFRGKLRIATPVGKWTLTLCSLWLASQCATDIVRHSAFADYARGWSNIGLTLVNLVVLWTLSYEQPKRLVLFGWGMVTGGMLFFLLNPSELMTDGAEGGAWKFGFAIPVSLGVFLLASRKECRGYWPMALAVMMGMINMILGSRNTAGECLAAATYIALMMFLGGKSTVASRLKAGTVAALAALILLSVVGVMWSYGRAASAGILGEDAKQKYEQESTGYYGVLLGGRPELLAELPAVYDSPILGHGSWAREPLYIIEQRQALLLLGYRDAAKMITREELRNGFIPSHSYLFGAWVDAGILGAVFWAWVFVMTARVLLRVHPADTELLPVVAFLAFLLLWNIPFSPFGTDGRLTFPYSFVLLMTLINSAGQKASQKWMAKNTIKAAGSPRRRPRSGPRTSGRSPRFAQCQDCSS